jgi:ribonuclease HI
MQRELKARWLGSLTLICTREKECCGKDHSTTNSRTELMSAINGLEALKRQRRVEAITDSQYVRKRITERIKIWKTCGWKTANKPVKNHDLWRRLLRLVGQHAVSWHWVKGDSGHRKSEIADTFANRGIDELN